MTIAILTWMKNASPTPRTCSGMVPEWRLKEDANGRREVEADRRPQHDRDDRPEDPGPQLAEVIDERHDRPVAGCGRRGRERLRVRRRRESGDTRLEQGVGVGHGRVANDRLARRTCGSAGLAGGAAAGSTIRAAGHRGSVDDRRRGDRGRGGCGDRWRDGRAAGVAGSGEVSTFDAHGVLDVGRRLAEFPDALAERRARPRAACRGRG